MKRIILGTAIIGTALALAACGENTASTKNAGLRHQQEISNGSINRIEQSEPAPTLSDSSDAHNQRIFYTEQSDPNKIEYLELISLSGQPYSHFTIKGQVSSMNTQETNPNQAYCVNGEKEKACTTIAQADPNGVYLGSDAGHFAITTSGALIEWEGNFVTSDQPFTIKTPVTMTLNESIAPTNTDTSKVSKGGLLPNGRSR